VLADPGFVKAEAIEVFDLEQIGLERLAEIGAWRMHRHHEVPEPHGAIGSMRTRVPVRVGCSVLSHSETLIA
jgi:hypothetical protein